MAQVGNVFRIKWCRGNNYTLEMWIS